MKTLKERLIFARELRGLTQKQLAEKCKCSQGTIGNVESGERKTLRNIVVVARKLNVSVDWLYDGTGTQPENEISGATTTYLKSGQVMATTALAFDGENGSLYRKEFDPWTLDAIGILSKLNESQKAAAVARLREFVGHLGPPREGQALQVAGG